MELSPHSKFKDVLLLHFMEFSVPFRVLYAFLNHGYKLESAPNTTTDLDYGLDNGTKVIWQGSFYKVRRDIPELWLVVGIDITA